ncbi:glycosyltransferase family 2 protein [Leptotrichia sp. OH3620_COT-345]|uniref:tetratricopeptide repeat-containing glycosyltransferase family 2 protein n=1 Tax=Leptotrichia sp. OH3620_COT-345 TaxID=2491048 RepID=UPI000F64EE9E|nr:glycosyltransferase family 2 protein [Leptotrichia sp. OH3620_COT-345]RRD40344.1 glycosyltransferase family 2 protein [Leptotrichia sp. OH3620_COT-345]
MTISTCILAKNEERNLKDCLESVKTISDEIIVVDNGSTDNTIKIAKDFECEIINSPNTIIDEGRNLYLEKAKSDWIFIIDADERLDLKSKNEIFKSIQTAISNPQILAFTLDSYQYTGKGKWATVKFIRLIKNGKNIKYQETPIHSDLETSILENKGIIYNCGAYIHHIDILINNRTKLKRKKYQNHILRRLEKENLNSITGAYLMCFLGLEYAAQKKFDLAEKCYYKVIEKNEKVKSFAKIFLSQNYILQHKYFESEKILSSLENKTNNTIDYQIIPQLIEIYKNTNRIKQAIKLCENEITKNEKLAHLYVNLAILYEDIFPEKTIELIEKANNINSYISNELIYKKGETPNIFEQQSCIINSLKTTKDIMEACCKKLGQEKRFEKIFIKQ